MTEIRITGAGGTISYEYYVILKALKEAGLTVVEQNDFPESNPQKHLKTIKRRITTEVIEDKEVKLIAVHVPWGG